MVSKKYRGNSFDLGDSLDSVNDNEMRNAKIDEVLSTIADKSNSQSSVKRKESMQMLTSIDAKFKTYLEEIDTAMKGLDATETAYQRLMSNRMAIMGFKLKIQELTEKLNREDEVSQNIIVVGDIMTLAAWQEFAKRGNVIRVKETEES